MLSIGIIVVICALVAVGVFLAVWFTVLKPKSKTTMSVKSSYLQDQTLSRNGLGLKTSSSSYVEDLKAPTQAFLDRHNVSVGGDITTYRLHSTRTGTDEEGGYIQDYNPDTNVSYRSVQFFPDAEDKAISHVLYEPRPATDLIVSLNNISGAIRGVALCDTVDMFSGGFNPSEGEDDDTLDTAGLAADFDNLISGMSDPSKTVALVGAGGFGLGHGSSDKLYPINVIAPTDLPMNSAVVFNKVVTSDSSPSTSGVVRMDMAYLEYVYTMNGNEQVLRLYGSHPDVPMATKAIWDGTFDSNGDRVFKFVDVSNPSAPTLVDTVADATKLLNFWDQPHHDNDQQEQRTSARATDQEREEYQTEKARLYQTKFRDARVPMPFPITNVEFDLSSVSSKNVTLDLRVNGTVAFSDALTANNFASTLWTEALLDENRAMQALLFQIDDLSLKMTIS